MCALTPRSHIGDMLTSPSTPVEFSHQELATGSRLQELATGNRVRDNEIDFRFTQEVNKECSPTI